MTTVTPPRLTRPRPKRKLLFLIYWSALLLAIFLAPIAWAISTTIFPRPPVAIPGRADCRGKQELLAQEVCRPALLSA